MQKYVGTFDFLKASYRIRKNLLVERENGFFSPDSLFVFSQDDPFLTFMSHISKLKVLSLTSLEFGMLLADVLH